MTDYPESGVKLVVDTADALSAVGELQSALDDIQSTSYTATVSTEVDDSGLSDLPTDGETIDVTADVTVEGDELPADGETVDSTVNTTVEGADDNSTGILQTLVSIKRNQQFRMALDIAGTAVDFFKSIGQFSVQPIVDLDTAMARLKATTGLTIPDADKLINKIFYSDLGESITEVSKLVGQAAQLKVPIDDAVTSTLKFTKVFTDQNPETVLNTLNQLVITGLEPNFTKAGDDLVTAFQNGANKGGDLLETLGKNATAIHDLGMNAQDIMAIVSSGLSAGFTSADEVIKTLEKIKQNVQGAAGNDKSKVSKTLDILGIANPAETGKAWSAEFFASVIEGIQKAPVSDSQKMEMFQNLVGGKLSTKEFSAFMKLSPEDAAAIFENTKGAAAKAAEDIDNSLQGAINDFERAAQGAAVDFLSSKQIDLPGKITALKEGLQNGLRVLQQGGSIQDAITVSLKPVGLDDTFNKFESVLGNFVISILQAVSTIQALTGHTTEAAQTQIEVGKLSQKQLTFDLKVGNEAEVSDAIQTAISRGVKPEDIAKSASDAVTELIKSGTPQAAQDLINKIGELGGAFGSHSVGDINVKPVIPKEQVDALQKQLDDTLSAQQKVHTAEIKDASLTVSNTIKPQLDTLKTDATNTSKPVQNTADATKNLGNNSKDATTHVGTAASATADFSVSAFLATGAVRGLITTVDGLIAEASKLAVANGAAKSGSIGVQADVSHHASGGDFVGTSVVGEKGREIISSNANVAVLNNLTTERLFAALQSFIPGAGSGNSSHVSNTIINQNNIPNIATGDALGYRQAATLRGQN